MGKMFNCSKVKDGVVWSVVLSFLALVQIPIWAQSGTTIKFARSYGRNLSGASLLSQYIMYFNQVKYVPWDSGYFTVGFFSLEDAFAFPPLFIPPQIFAVRTDKTGNPYWIKRYYYGSGDHDVGWGCEVTSDGNFLIAGTTTLGGTVKTRAFVTKIDPSGNVVWGVSVGGGPNDSTLAFDVFEHSNGNYIVVGADSAAGSPAPDGLVFALDNNGNLLWHTIVGNITFREELKAAVESDYGTIVAVGNRNADLYLVEVDASGNLLTATTFSNPLGFPIIGNDIAKKPSGGYVVVGSTFNGPDMDIILISLDNNFNIEWARLYNTSIGDQGFRVAVRDTVIYVAASASPPSNPAQVLLTLFAVGANTGNLLWDVGFADQFTSSFLGAGLDMTPTGPILAGWRTLLPGTGVAYHGLLVKTDFNGSIIRPDTCLETDISLTVDTVVLSVSGGGTVNQRLNASAYVLNVDDETDHDSICIVIENCNGIIDSIKIDSPLCVGDTSGYVYFWISNGTPPFTHYLSNGQVFTGDTVGPLPPGTYIDSIVDAAGCLLFDTFTIVAPDTIKILVDSIFPPTACGTTDGWIKITVTGGTLPYNISWSNGMTGDSIYGLGQGTYIVTVTDSNSCVATDTFVLNPQNGLSVSVTYSDPLCYGDSTGWIKVTVSNGTPPYTHVWSNGMTGDSIFNLPAGTYVDSIYDSTGCWIMDTITLVDPPQLVLTVVDSALPSTCGGSDGWIKVQASGGTPPITYTWSNGMTGDSIYGLLSGTYVVIATDSNGCSISDTVSLVDPNSPQITGTEVRPPTCNGDSSGWIYVQVSGGTPPYTHNWSNGTSTPSDTLFNVPAGTYTDTVVDAAGCIAIVTVTVPEPDPLQISLDITNPSSCTTPDGQVVATVSGGVLPYNLVWSTGTTGDTLKDVGPGSYTVYVRDSLGCVDSAVALLSSPDAPIFTLSDELISCQPPAYEVSVEVTGGRPPYIVYWDTYDTTTLLTDTLPPDTYIVVLQDMSGCLAYDTLILAMPDTVWAIAQPTVDTIAPGDTIQLIGETNGGIWWWSPGEYLDDSLSLTPVAQPIITTEFYFYSYNAQGCYDIDTILIVVEGDPIVYFPDYFTPNGDGVNDLFRPIYWGDVQIIWRVYNRWSEIVFEGTENEAWDGTYNGKPQQMDSYVLVAFITPRQGAQKGQTTKIVKNILLIR